jgi:hypothetical protein
LQQYSRDQENMPNMMNISDYTSAQSPALKQ